jgi:hypothetical protein
MLSGHSMPSAAARAHEPAAGAEPAVHGAAIRDEQQRPIRIAPDQIRRDLVRFLPERVQKVAFGYPSLVLKRHHLPADRARRITPVD